MKSILVSWVGEHDLASVEKRRLTGPIATLLRSDFSSVFDEIYLLYTYPEEECEKYFKLLSELSSINKIKVSLDDPMDYRNIYLRIVEILNNIKGTKSEVKWNFHTSPGTPAMSSIWILLGKTSYPADLFTSWVESGKERVKKLDIPFNIYFDFIPEFIKKEEEKIRSGWDKLPSFVRIIHKSPEMKKLLDLTYKISVYDIPVLILGETGTGKEMFAKSIHEASSRKGQMFKAVNCGAFPESLIETTLFGWSKGAFTGAEEDGKGLFRECDGGTLFLDEIGELSLNLQVKLLRVLQEKEFQRVGDNKTFKVNIRVIAATNKDIGKMVKGGEFREDLFHRLTIGILKLPPLRERDNDIILIAEHFLKEINLEFNRIEIINNYKEKQFSSSALQFIKSYNWPGNARELYNTIKRACIWLDNDKIYENDIKEAMLDYSNESKHSIHLPLKGIDLKKYLLGIEKGFALKAIKIKGSRAKAAKLLKMNPKTFEKRCKNILKIDE